MYFKRVVGTWFTDGLASIARYHIQDMEPLWPGLPAHKAARQHARTRAGSREGRLHKWTTHGGGVGEFFLFDLFFLLLLVLNTVETQFKIHIADYIMVLGLAVISILALMAISCPEATSSLVT